MHALCGTTLFRHACFDPVRDRDALALVFTPEVVEIALLFASADREALNDVAVSLDNDSEEPTDLPLDPRGPLSESIIRIDPTTRAALRRIAQANQHSQIS